MTSSGNTKSNYAKQNIPLAFVCENFSTSLNVWYCGERLFSNFLSSKLFFFYESEENQLSDSVYGSCISTITTYNTIKILATQTISNYIWKANNCFQQPFCFSFYVTVYESNQFFSQICPYRPNSYSYYARWNFSLLIVGLLIILLARNKNTKLGVNFEFNFRGFYCSTF